MCNIVTIYTIFLVFHAYFTPVMLISSCSFSLDRDVAEDGMGGHLWCLPTLCCIDANMN